ncbi:hypothetical protein EJB05_15173 [Eragrostis curvula]|uniref:Uncharacterized protein n=1 Tax=Eragrostis curvula TaxID=38414 RepID=A0A5J9W0I9_9POAL|nr:hypothetical protein EJB05_15173 [Eragrostis curvula]
MAYGGAGGSVPGHGAGGGLAEGGAGGRVADAGRPYFVPVVFVPSIKAKEEIALGITAMPPKPSNGYKRGTQASQEGLPIWSRHVWDVVKQGLQGVTRCCAKLRDGWPRVWAKIRQVCSGRRKRRSAV